MDWKLIGKYGAPAVLLGFLDVFGILPGNILFFGLVGLAFIWSLTAARQAPDAPFTTALMMGLLAGFLIGDVWAIFFDQYIENHPDQVQQLAEQDLSLSRIRLLLNGLWAGTILGALAGIGAMVSVRFTKRRTERQEDGTAGIAPLGSHMDVTHPESDGTGAEATAATAAVAGASVGTAQLAGDSEE